MDCVHQDDEPIAPASLQRGKDFRELLDLIDLSDRRGLNFDQMLALVDLAGRRGPDLVRSWMSGIAQIQGRTVCR